MSSKLLTDMGSIVNIIGKTHMIFCKENIFTLIMNKIFLLALRNYEENDYSLDLDLLVLFVCFKIIGEVDAEVQVSILSPLNFTKLNAPTILQLWV